MTTKVAVKMKKNLESQNGKKKVKMNYLHKPLMSIHKLQ